MVPRHPLYSLGLTPITLLKALRKDCTLLYPVFSAILATSSPSFSSLQAWPIRRFSK